MIIAKNISYRIGGKQILHPMSFKADSGMITVLLGANGAGKSTLLRLLAGETHPDEGEISLDGQPLSGFSLQTLARKRAVLTQNYSVPLPFTCEEIVMMGRYPYEGISTHKENKEIAAYCMDELEIRHLSQRMFNTLSGGEQQRVQMARVLAQLTATKGREKKVLLLDEPTSNLDYLQQQLILAKVKLLASKGYTVMVVLHDLNLAAQYADKILLLKEGHLLAKGNVEEVLQPSLIYRAYDIEVDVVKHKDYPFPILIPALHHQNRISQFKKHTIMESTLKKTSLSETWLKFHEDNPRTIIRNGARELNTTEAEILASFTGKSVTRLNNDFSRLLKRMPEIGYIKSVTRNDDCVHEKFGWFQAQILI